MGSDEQGLNKVEPPFESAEPEAPEAKRAKKDDPNEKDLHAEQEPKPDAAPGVQQGIHSTESEEATTGVKQGDPGTKATEESKVDETTGVKQGDHSMEVPAEVPEVSKASEEKNEEKALEINSAALAVQKEKEAVVEEEPKDDKTVHGTGAAATGEDLGGESRVE